jgi:hypothetical protein
MTKFVSSSDYATVTDVAAAYPGAAHIAETDGGWAVFETQTDYQIWMAQV